MQRFINLVRVICGCIIVFLSIQLPNTVEDSYNEILQFRERTEGPYNESIKDTIIALDSIDVLIEKTQKDNEKLTALMASTRKSIKAIRALNKSSGKVGATLLEGAEMMPTHLDDLVENFTAIERGLHAAGSAPSGPIAGLNSAQRGLFSAERTIRGFRATLMQQSKHLKRDLPQVKTDYKLSTQTLEKSLSLYENQIESWENGPVKQMPETLESIQTQLHSTINLLHLAKDLSEVGETLTQDVKNVMLAITIIFSFFGFCITLGGLSSLMVKK